MNELIDKMDESDEKQTLLIAFDVKLKNLSMVPDNALVKEGAAYPEFAKDRVFGKILEDVALEFKAEYEKMVEDMYTTVHMHAYIHTCTLRHVYMHMYIHLTCFHVGWLRLVRSIILQIFMHSHVRTHTNATIKHRYTHEQIHSHSYTSICECAHVYNCAHARIHTKAYVYAHVHTPDVFSCGVATVS